MHTKKIIILLPALNEEKNISDVLKGIPVAEIENRGYKPQIVVVDGHSEDQTVAVAKQNGAICLKQPGKGKGDAVKYALRQVRGEFLFMLDADNTYPPDYIIPMLDILEKKEADVVMGSRLSGKIENGAMTRMNYIGNRILTATANFFFSNGYKITDLCTGMWGFNRKAQETLAPLLTANGFDIEAELFAKAMKNGLKVREIPIHYGRREGPSKLGSLRDGAKIMGRLVKESFIRQSSVR